MEITIRKGVKEDLDCVLELIKELADYENELNAVSYTHLTLPTTVIV